LGGCNWERDLSAPLGPVGEIIYADYMCNRMGGIEEMERVSISYAQNQKKETIKI